MEDKTDLEVVILDQMTQVNNYNELKADDPSCDLMFSYDGTVLTTFLGMDTADIPEGESLYDFVNQAVGEQEGLRLLGKVGLNNTYSIGVTQAVVDTYGCEQDLRSGPYRRRAGLRRRARVLHRRGQHEIRPPSWLSMALTSAPPYRWTWC